MCVSCSFSTNIVSLVREVLHVLYALMAARSWTFPYAAELTILQSTPGSRKVPEPQDVPGSSVQRLKKGGISRLWNLIMWKLQKRVDGNSGRLYGETVWVDFNNLDFLYVFLFSEATYDQLAAIESLLTIPTALQAEWASQIWLILMDLYFAL